MKEILFKGKKYLFGGESLDENGFIATKYQYENFLCSFAHYYSDKGVNRFGEFIGTRKDIKILGEKDIKPNPKAMKRMLEGKPFVNSN